MKAKTGDVYCCYNKYLEQYTAVQVVKVDGKKDKNAILLTIDWVGDAPMTEQDLSQIKPLYPDYLHWDKGLHLTNVGSDVPGNYTLVGNCEPLTDESANSYSDWGRCAYTIYSQIMWERVAEEKRTAFKAASKSDEKVMLAGQEMPLSTSRFDDSDFAIETINELSVLPCLTALYCQRWYDGLHEYLQNFPFISKLHLSGHEQKILDVRKSHLRTLSVDLTGVEAIYLNDDLEELVLLSTAPDDCYISTKDNGRNLQIDFHATVKRYPSLTKLTALHCRSIEEIDLVELVKFYPNLEELRLFGKPGIIKNLAHLTEFKEIQRFSTMDLYGFSADDIPQPEKMEKLYWFWMSHLPEDAAKAIRQLYKKRKSQGLDLRIQKSHKPEWMAQNLDNPFRSWGEQENIPQIVFKKAIRLYKNMHRQMLLLAGSDEKSISKQVTDLVIRYTIMFNKMDRDRGFIKTAEREDISAALAQLLAILPKGRIKAKAMFKKFDQFRDF